MLIDFDKLKHLGKIVELKDHSIKRAKRRAYEERGQIKIIARRNYSSI